MSSAMISILEMVMAWVVLVSYCDAWYVCQARNCVMNSWSPWSLCSSNQCEKLGTQSRTRSVRVQPQCGGSRCPNDRSQTRSCYGSCKLSEWSPWGLCDADQCGVLGFQFRTRMIVSPPSCRKCPDSLLQSQSCFGNNPVNCQLSEWSPWGLCSANQCNVPGFQLRSRSMVTPPSCGGTPCPDDPSESQACLGSNPVSCQLSDWSPWGLCSANQCNVPGFQLRSRSMVSPPSCGGTPCPDDLSESQACLGSNPVNCHLSGWSPWGICSENLCNVPGFQLRSRSIVSPPSCGGAPCPDLSESQACLGSNPVNCQLSDWSAWSVCTTTCGVLGTQTSSRRKITTENCGGTCPSTFSKTRSCPISCLNGGSLNGRTCLCKKGYSGDCCEEQTTIIENMDCADGTNITFDLVIPDIDEWQDSDTSVWALSNDVSCEPTIEADRLSYSGIDGDTCGTLSDDGDNLVYTFTIFPSSTGLTRQYDHSYNIQCLYEKEKQGLQASFIPQHSVEGSSADNSVLDFSFDLYLDSDDSLVNTATTYDLRTTFRGVLSVVNNGFPNVPLDVHFKSVQVANNNQNNNPTTLITDGCSLDTNVASHPICLPPATTDSFTLDAFRFFGQTKGDTVWITVAAVVCIEKGKASTCVVECSKCKKGGLDIRKRRYTLEESVQAEYYLKYGPLSVADLKKEEKDDTNSEKVKDSSVPAYFLAIGVVGGVVTAAIVGVVVIIVYRKRRAYAALAESRDAIEVTPTGV